MTFDHKTKNWLIIGGSSLILIVLLIILFSGLLNPKKPQINQKNNGSVPSTEESSEIVKPATYTAETVIPQATPLDDRGRLEIQLEKKAAAFVERWASISNQDNFSNINILENSMTEEMIAWANNYIKQQNNQKKTDIYQGTSATAIVSEGSLSSSQADSISVKVKIRGQEMLAASNGQAKVFYQTYNLEFKKVDSIWLANKLTWQERQY
ncbi:MAG TPA: hypothetical protein PKN62_01990 [bacterium]|nr:hypothetical protein [bacterium]